MHESWQQPRRWGFVVEVPLLRGPGGRPLRLAHLTTVGISQAKLLQTELRVDVASGLDTVALSAPDEYVTAVEALGVPHVPLPALTRAWDPRRDAAAARQLASTLRSLDLDVLHTHNPKTGVLGRLLGRAVRVPVVVNTCHGLWAQSDDPFARRAFVLGMEAVAGRASDAELYQNAEDRETLARWVPKRRSRVVGNGTDLASFGPDAAARARVRAEWGIPDGALVVGGVGRMVAEKGIRELGETARALGGGLASSGWVRPIPTSRTRSPTRSPDCRRWVAEMTWPTSTTHSTCSCCRPIGRASPARGWRLRRRACRWCSATSADAERSVGTSRRLC